MNPDSFVSVLRCGDTARVVNDAPGAPAGTEGRLFGFYTLRGKQPTAILELAGGAIVEVAGSNLELAPPHPLAA